MSDLVDPGNKQGDKRMTIPDRERVLSRTPHPFFAAWWVFWYANVITAVVFVPNKWYALGVLLSFFPTEGYAVAKHHGGSRDTLSEIMTWAQRYVSKTTAFMRSWNALMLLLVLIVAWLTARTVYDFSGSWYIAAPFLPVVTVWLYDHWMRPDLYG